MCEFSPVFAGPIPTISTRYGSFGAVTTTYARDAAGRVVSESRAAEGAGTLSSATAYDGERRVTSETDEQGRTTSYAYSADGRTVTATSRSTPVTAYDFCAYNPFRFSSEYADDTSELAYYNYRHYNLQDGRWITRDAIEEFGGLHLYAYCNNNMSCDFLGLEEPCCCKVCVYSAVVPEDYKKREPLTLDTNWEGHTWLVLEDCNSPEDELANTTDKNKIYCRLKK